MSQLYDKEYSHDKHDSLDGAMPGTAMRRESERLAKKPYRPPIFDNDVKPQMSQTPVADCISAGRRMAMAVSMYATEGQIDPTVNHHLKNLMMMMSDTQAQQAELLAEQQAQQMDANDADHRINSLQQGTTQLTHQLASLQDGMASMTTALTALNTQMATVGHSEWRTCEQVGNMMSVHHPATEYEMPLEPRYTWLRSADFLGFSMPAQPIAAGYMLTAHGDAAQLESNVPYRAVTLIDTDSTSTTSGMSQSRVPNSVSRECSTVYHTLHAEFSMRSHRELGLTPGREDRSSHHEEVKSLQEDEPARQASAQMTEAWSATTPASPVPTTHGHHCQNGGRAAAATYPTGPVDNGDDPILNVAGEVFVMQMADLVEEHFSMFQMDWTWHMEIECVYDDACHKKLTALTLQYPQGIPANKLPRWSPRPTCRGPMEMPMEITGHPLTKPTATFKQGKDTDVPDNVTYAQAIKSYMGYNYLDYDRYGISLLASNTSMQFGNAFFNVTHAYGGHLTWRKAVFFFLKATPASLSIHKAQSIMEQVVLTSEQMLPEFVNNFLLLRFCTGNHMQLRVVIDCLFCSIGLQMEMMLHTEVPHTGQQQCNLYRMLDVLANAEEDRNRYRPNAVSARLMHQWMEKYAATVGIMLRGLHQQYQVPLPTTRNQVLGTRPQQPAGPAMRFAPTDQ
ncbi:hypothetical protein H4R24_005041 [Coemansia sp. RSA 988]|nr:hypothetical protein H4R24_005041 [Coemansia sp. RSA 988]